MPIERHVTVARDTRTRTGRWILALFAVVSVACARTGEETRSRPNLIVFLSDALRAASLPDYGYRAIATPALSRLAGEGIRFEQHYANFPGTPVSVSQMQSGRLMPPLLMDFSFALAPTRAVTRDLLVLPRELRRMGYSTFIVTSHPWFNERARILKEFQHQELVRPRAGADYAGLEDLALKVDSMLDIAESGKSPFFLYIHSMDTHGPYHSLARFASKSPRPTLIDRYDSAIRSTDYWVGRLLERLESDGELDRTVFVFTSDHGEDLGELGPEWWNREHGATLRESQLHVPLIIRLPAKRLAGTSHANTTTHVDLAPTLVHLVDPNWDLSEFRYDGRDLGGDLDSEQLPPVTIAYTWRYWCSFAKGTWAVLDQWKDEMEVSHFRVDERNFPRPEAIEDETLREGLGAALKHERERRLREFIEAPSDDTFLRRGVAIGIPTTHVRGESSYQDLPDDSVWWQKDVRVLAASADERPQPLVVSTPWIKGKYHIWVRLDRSPRFANNFELRFLPGDDDWLEVSRSSADERGWVDLGYREIDQELTVEIANPRGGVRLLGFYVSEDAAASKRPQDEGLEKDLRALGYVG